MQNRILYFLTTEVRGFFLRNIHTARCLLETHYDVLKLPKNCSSQEIRSSFIKLSKEYHPDKNIKDDKSHALFVKLNEAYTVLSRPDTRKAYDLSLIPIKPVTVTQSDFYDVHHGKPFKDPTFWMYRDKSKMKYNRPYYGIKGVDRMSNTWIVVFCVLFTAIGVALQVVLIRESVSFSRKTLDEQSHQNALTYAMVREKARREGDESLVRRIELNADQYVSRQQAAARREN